MTADATESGPHPSRPGLSVDLPVLGRAVTVVGSSGRAMTATGALIRAGAVVTVIAAYPTPYLSDLADRGLIRILQKDFAPADIASAALVFAHTGLRALDAAVSAEAHKLGVFCIGGGADEPSQQTQRNGRPRVGRVILVGGGPGDPGLLTVAGRDAIAAADVIVTDRLAPVAALGELAPRAVIIDASKVPGGRRVEQSQINALLIQHALEGKTVVRLKGGDGFVFGRGGEEADECVRAGIAVDVIPGVSSAIAAPASAMIPVTHRGLIQGFTVVSGHVPPDHPESAVNYAALAQTNTTIILMMAVANLGAIAHALIDGGMDPHTPAAVIADGSLPSQRAVRATLDTISDAARTADIGPPATVVIGAVAGFVPGQALRQTPARLNVR